MDDGASDGSRRSSLESHDPWPDLERLCALGGRLCGTPGEAEARAFLTGRLQEIAESHGGQVLSVPHDYLGWRARDCRIEAQSSGQTFEGYPLLHSPSTAPGGLNCEVLDLGRGTDADIAAHSAEIAGRIVLTRHEFMFSPEHIHRNRKYMNAVAHGAAGFLIAGGADQVGMVGGGVGFGDADTPIPAAGISAETATALAGGADGPSRARLTIAADTAPAHTETLVYERAGETPEWIVISAHLDGHGLAQSAIDNATGVAAAISAASDIAAHAPTLTRGLRLCLFSIEEWGLLGSRDYLAGLGREACEAISLNVNLDSVAGAAGLAALYSEFPALADFLRDVADEADTSLALHEPLVRNSDHYNFAAAGIPACRLMAGFEMPKSNLRHVLTAEDTIDKVSPEQLRLAAALTAQIVMRACTAPELDLRAGRREPAS